MALRASISVVCDMWCELAGEGANVCVHAVSTQGSVGQHTELMSHTHRDQWLASCIGVCRSHHA